MILITLSGSKHSKKNLLAMRLAQNSDCIWIHPYTDRKVPVSDLEEDEYIHLNEKQLSDKMEREIPLAFTEVNGNRYVFFKNQLRAEYVVLIADDRVVSYLKNNWKGDMVTVRVHANGEEYSKRNLFDDSEFDIIFNYDTGDYEDFESQIVYR